MDYAQTQSGYVGTAMQDAEQGRTFDGISAAVKRVNASTDQVRRMLDRICPAPRDVPEGAIGSVLSKSSYAASLEQLQGALNSLGYSLDELEKHI